MKASKIHFPYFNELAEYALANLKANKLDLAQIKSSTLTVTMASNQAVFEQSTLTSAGKALLDCWDIFSLAKKIQDLKNINFCRIKVIMQFKDGVQSCITFKIYPVK